MHFPPRREVAIEAEVSGNRNGSKMRLHLHGRPVRQLKSKSMFFLV